MLTLGTEIVEINDDETYEAKVLASLLSTEQARKRAVIDFIGTNCAYKYLFLKKIKVSNKKSVYKIPFLYEEFKITDLHYGNYRIDVITLFKEKTVKIPKIHVDMEILPHFYFVIQVGSKIKEAKIIGFIDAKNIQNSSHDSKYYYPSLDLIFGLEKFNSCTKHTIAAKTTLGKHVDCLGLFLKFIDNDLSSAYKKQLIQHLMNCESCRSRFIEVMEFEKLANNIHYYPQLIKKYEEKDTIDTSSMKKNEADDISLEEAINNKKIQKPLEYDYTSLYSQELKQNDDMEYFLEGNDGYDNSNMQIFDTAEKKNKSAITKKIIDIIFNEMPKMELPMLKTLMRSKNRRLTIVTVSVLFVLVCFALISLSGAHEAMLQKQNMENNDKYNTDGFDYALEYDLPPANGHARLIPKNTSYDDYAIKQPVPTKPAYTPEIQKVAWEVPQELAKKDVFAKYLKMAGKNIKMSLQNEMLSINDVPANRLAVVEILFSGIGGVLKIDTYQSSGSRVIDETIIKTVGTTLSRIKPPSIKGNEDVNSVLLKVSLE